MMSTPNPTAERWRKKPVEIEAMVYDGENWAEIAQWLRAHEVKIGCTSTGKASIPTLEGTIYASPGDYIIRGVQGEFYPCKPDIFKQTYEPAGLLSEGAPSEEQIERAARAIRADYVQRYPEEPPVYHAGAGQPVWRHMARAALEAAGVASQEVIDDAVFRAAAAIAETQARRQNLPPEVIQGVTRGHIQDAKAALTAAQPVLDPEKVAEVVRPYDPDTAEDAACALCEAAKRGELSI